jgi:preprotein translocase subunit SecY
MFSGGALSRFTVFALGIMPYISASIIMQLMTYVVPSLEALKKEGEAGTAQDHAVHALRHAVAGVFQSLGIALALEGSPGLVLAPGFGFRMTAVVSLVAGTMFLMWLGEQITERGPWQRHFDPDLRRHRRGPAQRDRRSVRAGSHRCDEPCGRCSSSQWSCW